ncbi:MAG: hypothetical protein WBD31_04730 [Rubripirellula sp.]
MKLKYLLVGLLLLAIPPIFLLCAGAPLLFPNREGFPPWEKFPDGNGITYVDKYTHDPGIDPLYLASFRYDDDAALERFIQTFGLVPLQGEEDAATFTTTMPDPVPWFPLSNVTTQYVYPDKDVEYVANVWIDSTQNYGIIERTWW